MANTTFTGPVISTNGFEGALEGNVTGNIVGALYSFTTAITADTTTTTAPAGSLGITSNATGKGYVFYSDGSKWQDLLVVVPD